MTQAEKEPGRKDAVTRRAHEFTLCGVQLIIPAGSRREDCITAEGELIDEALGAIEVVAMSSKSEPADLSLVWSAYHLLEVAKAMNQAAQLAHA